MPVLATNRLLPACRRDRIQSARRAHLVAGVLALVLPACAGAAMPQPRSEVTSAAFATLSRLATHVTHGWQDQGRDLPAGW